MDPRRREHEGKLANDPLSLPKKQILASNSGVTAVDVPGVIIVGAGPSGLAVAACLKDKGIPCLVLERHDCIASLWQLKTYDRLRLHLPKHYCELPLMAFPADYPTYPSKVQFVRYLESYCRRFDISPLFRRTVVGAEFDGEARRWRVTAQESDNKTVQFMSQWLAVASGENAEPAAPCVEGLEEFNGPVVHTSEYKNGGMFAARRVLVVGCGNSGMEVCLDLCNHGALPDIVVRDSVHVLPREMLGQSTFGLSMWLLKWLPVRAVDRLVLLLARLVLGDTTPLGLRRPVTGPLELKLISGKTPVLDVGALKKIKSGDIKVRPAIRRVDGRRVDFADGESASFDAVVLATGYRSNVPSWLKEKGLFSEKDGLLPNSWKGERGLYAVGFSKRGLMGSAANARRIAGDVEASWTALKKMSS